MLRKLIPGEMFGKVKIIEPCVLPTGRVSVSKHKCLCTACGKEFYANRYHLLIGKYSSCGCLKPERNLKILKEHGSKITHAEIKKLGTSPAHLKREPQHKNKFGVNGVTERSDGFRADIIFRGVSYYLGLYRTLEEAVAARKFGEEILYKPMLDAKENGTLDEYVPKDWDKTELRNKIKEMVKETKKP